MKGTRVDFKKNNIYHGNGTIEEDVMAFVTRSVINPDDGKWKWAMNEQVFDTVCEFKKELNFYRLRFGLMELERILGRYLALAPNRDKTEKYVRGICLNRHQTC